MTTDLVLHSPDQAFGLAERIAKSNLIPSAYRGKPVEAAVAMMYGAEIGLPPMTSLNRIVVVEGKPTLDAQGMVAVIRKAGHSVSGETDSEKAVVRGRRGDTGDEMAVTFTMEDAKRANLAGKNAWRAYPSAMLWARAVSQLARMLFADCLLGFSYVPEEADFDGKLEFDSEGAPVPEVAAAPAPVVASAPTNRRASGTVRRAPGKPEADQETGEIIEAEVVEETTQAAPPAPDAPAAAREINKLRKVYAREHEMTDEEAMRAHAGSVLKRDVEHLSRLTVAEVDVILGVLQASPAAQEAVA